MIAINQKTNKVFEGSKAFIARTIGVNEKTLWSWENEKLRKTELYNNYLVIFSDVIREKQEKGFRLSKNKINICRFEFIKVNQKESEEENMSHNDEVYNMPE
jgi:DNA-binding XRE family transcriptional regulator